LCRAHFVPRGNDGAGPAGDGAKDSEFGWQRSLFLPLVRTPRQQGACNMRAPRRVAGRPLLRDQLFRLIIHVAHAGARTRMSGRRLLLRQFGDHGLRRDEEPGD
jgi:hypothetical protein